MLVREVVHAIIKRGYTEFIEVVFAYFTKAVRLPKAAAINHFETTEQKLNLLKQTAKSLSKTHTSTCTN